MIDSTRLQQIERWVQDIHQYIFACTEVDPPKRRMTRRQKVEAEIRKGIETDNIIVKPMLK